MAEIGFCKESEYSAAGEVIAELLATYQNTYEHRWGYDRYLGEAEDMIPQLRPFATRFGFAVALDSFEAKCKECQAKTNARPNE